MTAVLALSAAYPVLAVLVVVVADAWEARQFRGRFDCGCPWPPEDEDCPGVVTCEHGSWQFRPWKNLLGTVKDAWEAIDEGKRDE